MARGALSLPVVGPHGGRHADGAKPVQGPGARHPGLCTPTCWRGLVARNTRAACRKCAAPWWRRSRTAASAWANAGASAANWRVKGYRSGPSSCPIPGSPPGSFFAGIPLRTGYLGEFRHGLLNDRRRLDRVPCRRLVESATARWAPAGAASSQVPTARSRFWRCTRKRQKASLARLGLQRDRRSSALCRARIRSRQALPGGALSAWAWPKLNRVQVCCSARKTVR